MPLFWPQKKTTSSCIYIDSIKTTTITGREAPPTFKATADYPGLKPVESKAVGMIPTIDGRFLTF